MRSSISDLNIDPDNDFRNEVRSYFGTGTQLQEMYITPSLLTDQNWDDLAEAAKWARANAGRAEGHALGRRRSGMARGLWLGCLVARQSHSRPSQSERQAPKHYSEVAAVFELPAGAAQAYTAKSPWKERCGPGRPQLERADQRTSFI